MVNRLSLVLVVVKGDSLSPVCRLAEDVLTLRRPLPDVVSMGELVSEPAVLPLGVESPPVPRSLCRIRALLDRLWVLVGRRWDGVLVEEEGLSSSIVSQ
jgi:hypothetical protein